MSRAIAKPQHNNDAEQSVLGAILLRPDAIAQLNGLQAEDFYDPRRREVFAAMRELQRRRQPIDPIMLERVLLEREGRFEAVGGLVFISELAAVVPTADNIAHYAEIVHNDSLARQLRVHAAEIAASGSDTDDLFAQAKRFNTWIEGATSRRRPPHTIADVARSAAFRVPQKTYASGFDALDTLIAGGIKTRQLTVLVGGTGIGKTALQIQIAKHLAPIRPVLIVSTEIDEAELTARAASAEVNASIDEILGLAIDPDVVADVLASTRIYVEEYDGIDTRDPMAFIRERAESIRVLTAEIPIVIVDYLQQLASEDPELRRMGVSAVANRLRRLARQLDTPVLALSSIGRASYVPPKEARGEDGKENPRAWLAAAKESGDIEYCSAVVLFLEVGAEIAADKSQPARLIVCKSRRGKAGFVPLRYHGARGLFTASDEAQDSLGMKKRQAELEKAILAAVDAFVAHHKRGPTKRELRVKVKVPKGGGGEKAVRDAIDDMVNAEPPLLAYVTAKRMNAAGRPRTDDVLVRAEDVAQRPLDVSLETGAPGQAPIYPSHPSGAAMEPGMVSHTGVAQPRRGAHPGVDTGGSTLGQHTGVEPHLSEVEPATIREGHKKPEED